MLCVSKTHKLHDTRVKLLKIYDALISLNYGKDVNGNSKALNQQLIISITRSVVRITLPLIYCKFIKMPLYAAN